MDVYADMLFLIDFFMDLVCLFLTKRALSVPGGNKRLYIGAAIGGGYSVLSLFIPGGFFSVTAALGALLAVTFISFYRIGDSLARQGKITLTYLGMNALLGGTVSAVFGLFTRLEDSVLPDIEGVYARDGERMIFLALAAGCLISSVVVGRIKESRLDKVKQVKIKAFSGEITLLAINDSGNLLREPLSGRPCIFIGGEDLVSLAGKERGRAFFDFSSGTCPEGACGILLIPANTVGGRTLLPGFYPDSVELIDSEGKTIKYIETAVALEKESAIRQGSAVLPAALL